jgi:hypothetical protein
MSLSTIIVYQPAAAYLNPCRKGAKFRTDDVTTRSIIANCNHMSISSSAHCMEREDLILLDINATPNPVVRTVNRIHCYHHGRKLNLCRWWRHLTALCLCKVVGQSVNWYKNY